MITRKTLLSALAGLALAGVSTSAIAQQTTLRIFTGGQQRPDVMRQIADEYQKRNPAVKIEVEVGGATSEQQQQYLNTVLASKDSALDVVLIDRHPSRAVGGGRLGRAAGQLPRREKDAVMARYLPAYREANIVGGRVIALPYSPTPSSSTTARISSRSTACSPQDLGRAEGRRREDHEGRGQSEPLRLPAAGAPIEGTVCTYLVPMWGAGGSLTNAQGQLQLNTEAAKRPFQLWADLKAANVTPPNLAEIPDRIRQNFQAGNLIFGMNWGYVWNRTQNDADSQIKDKVGVVPLPGFTATPPPLASAAGRSRSRPSRRTRPRR